MMKTVLVTGGAGFIGSNFVRHIFKKYSEYRITVLDTLTYAANLENLPDSIKESARFTFWYGNINNLALVSTLVAKADIVVHFAAESHVARSIFDNRLFYETDVLGTQSVANAVLDNISKVERFIHISTSEVYGSAAAEPMSEEHPLDPSTPYASAKAGADRLVFSYWKTYGIPVIILRPFNNYGPCQHLEKVIPRFITSALLNESLTIHGDGKNSRDWTFVEDTSKAIDRVMHCDLSQIKGEVINLGSGKDVDILTIAKMVLDRLGKSKSLISHISDRPGQVKRHISSTQKAKELLDWKAETSFENGLDKTIEWYQKNKKWWEKMLWMRHVPIITKTGKVEMH
jgi:dTDP-glucose 4,6-dehydratase